MRFELAATILLTTSPSLVAAAAITTTTTTTGFYTSCFESWSLGYRNDPHFLVAQCAGSDGTNHTSALDLQDCLTNTEGVLAGQALGHAFNSCQSCTASTTDSTLTCQCRNSSNRYLTTQLDLDTVISTSSDGIIECFGLPGIKVS